MVITFIYAILNLMTLAKLRLLVLFNRIIELLHILQQFNIVVFLYLNCHICLQDLSKYAPTTTLRYCTMNYLLSITGEINDFTCSYSVSKSILFKDPVNLNLL